eukprot:5523764-Ditylum_brightwellii.AAC.1
MTHPLTVSSRMTVHEAWKKCLMLNLTTILKSKLVGDLLIPNNVTNDELEGMNRKTATASQFLNSKATL